MATTEQQALSEAVDRLAKIWDDDVVPSLEVAAISQEDIRGAQAAFDAVRAAQRRITGRERGA